VRYPVVYNFLFQYLSRQCESCGLYLAATSGLKVISSQERSAVDMQIDSPDINNPLLTIFI
ncbi:hypothetical protein, partial [Neptunomonas sp.]|uniref:hypothetical protein n=1 Tax=Neptunomonas sp. TaxID=1971898 RepID=UPI00356474FD